VASEWKLKVAGMVAQEFLPSLTPVTVTSGATVSLMTVTEIGFWLVDRPHARRHGALHEHPFEERIEPLGESAALT